MATVFTSPNPLASQIKGAWGGLGNWSDRGVDHISALAEILGRRGVTDISGLGIKAVDAPKQWEPIPQLGDNAGAPTYGPDYDPTATEKRYQLTYGGQDFGYLPGMGQGASRPYIGDAAGSPYSFAFNPSGKGGTFYDAVLGPEGQFLGVRPNWESSSDAGNVQDILKGVGYVAGAGLGLNALGGLAGGGSGEAIFGSLPDAYGGIPDLASIPGTTESTAALADLAGGLDPSLAPLTAAQGAAGAPSTMSSLTDFLSGFGSKLVDQVAADPLKTLSTGGALLGALTNRPGSAPTFDATGAAAAQGAASKDASLFDAYLNRPDQVTPYGSLTWKLKEGADPKNPQPGDWIQEMALNPEQGNLLSSQTGVSQGLANLTQGSLGQVGQALGQPLDLSGAPGRATLDPSATSRESIYEALVSRLRPEWARDEESARSRLLNTGFEMGSEGWDRALERLDRSKTDAQLQAWLRSGEEMARESDTRRADATFTNENRQDAIAEAILRRQQPLTELNALRSGAQPQMPEFKNFSTTNTQAAPVLEAMLAKLRNNQANFANDQNGYNALLAALAGLGGSYLGSQP